LIKKTILLFKIGRKLAKSEALNIISETYNPPFLIKFFFIIFGFKLSRDPSKHQNKTSGQRLCLSLQEMGTTFIKLGQFLATRPDIIGENLAKDLETLQDKLPEFEKSEATLILKKGLEENVYNNISEFSEPIAAASIAQVHFAKIKINGDIKEVAIKILRPSIEKIFNEEIDALMLLASLTEKIVSKSRRLKLIEVVHLLREITNLEMDLRFEAAAANELYENTKDDIGFNVPKIYWNFTTKNILTLDKIDGISIRESEQLKKNRIDVTKLSKNIIQHFLRQAIRDGFFHADMHQGNIFVNKNGEIIPVDFGIMGRLDDLSKRYLAEILYGFTQRDYKKVAKVHLLANLVPKNTSLSEFAQALRSIGEPIFGQSVKNISGSKLLNQLFEVTEKFNMQTQPQLLLLQKTMVVVEGVARKLDPETDIWETSKPILENWLKETKDPLNKINKTFINTSEVIKRLPELPEIMDKANQALTSIAEGKITPNSSTYYSLKKEKLKIKSYRNNFIIAFLILVIFLLLVF
jgi:ubiquinone biosynthesis protein